MFFKKHAKIINDVSNPIKFGQIFQIVLDKIFGT